MENFKIIEGNKLITKFDSWELINLNKDDPEDSDFDCWIFKNKISGLTFSGDDWEIFNKDSFIEYDFDYNWLMPVVFKINKLKYDDYPGLQDYLLLNWNVHLFSPINEIFETVVKFIEWYNEQQKINLVS